MEHWNEAIDEFKEALILHEMGTTHMGGGPSIYKDLSHVVTTCGWPRLVMVARDILRIEKRRRWRKFKCKLTRRLPSKGEARC